MSVGRRPREGAVLVALGLALAIGGCGTNATVGDKAGADEPPITLTLGTAESEGAPGTAALKHFAAEVADRSGGRITVRLAWNAAGDATDFEGEIVQQVRDGRLDLGWVGSRAWEAEGLSGFSALQAPFLITNYGVLDAVMASDLPGQMLAELDRIGLTGLGAYPDQLRHPLGFEAPFLTLADFAGARIRVPPSRISDELLSALGAVPVHLTGAALHEAVASGDVQGADSSVGNAASFPAGSYLTMNITFYPKVFTLFADTAPRYASLSENARSVLEAAADDTLTFVLGQDPERADIEAFCDTGGTLANASADEVERMAEAAESITRALEADPSVAEYIRQIEDLRRSGTPLPSETICP
jgi:TRAP-type C4-dicarboxylate transport system substrate-binding protein